VPPASLLSSIIGAYCRLVAHGGHRRTQRHRAIANRRVRAFWDHSLFHIPISSKPSCNILARELARLEKSIRSICVVCFRKLSLSSRKNVIMLRILKWWWIIPDRFACCKFSRRCFLDPRQWPEIEWYMAMYFYMLTALMRGTSHTRADLVLFHLLENSDSQSKKKNSDSPLILLENNYEISTIITFSFELIDTHKFVQQSFRE
jgi:hypothetical protein